MYGWSWALGVQEQMLTVDEVAAKVGLSRRAVYREIERGRLRASRLASRLRVEPAAVEEWIEANRIVPTEQPSPPVGRRPRTGGLRARLVALGETAP